MSLTHNGLVVEQNKGEGGAWLSQVPQVGDVVTFESRGLHHSGDLRRPALAGTNGMRWLDQLLRPAHSRLHHRRRLLHGRAPPQILRQAQRRPSADPGAHRVELRRRLSRAARRWRDHLRRRVADLAARGWRHLHLLKRVRPPGRRLSASATSSASSSATTRARRCIREIHGHFDRQAASLRLVDSRDDQPAWDDRRGSLPAQRCPAGVRGDKQTSSRQGRAKSPRRCCSRGARPRPMRPARSRSRCISPLSGAYCLKHARSVKVVLICNAHRRFGCEARVRTPFANAASVAASTGATRMPARHTPLLSAWSALEPFSGVALGDRLVTASGGPALALADRRRRATPRPHGARAAGWVAASH